MNEYDQEVIEKPRYDYCNEWRSNRYEWACQVDPQAVKDYHANIDRQLAGKENGNG